MFKRKEKEPVNQIEPWYDITSAMPTALGTALIKMGTGGIGYPALMPKYQGDNGYDNWQADLVKYGTYLKEYGDARAIGDEVDVEEAKKALYWVANHLEALWD